MGTALGVISCAVSAAKGATKLEQQLTGGRAGIEERRQRGTAGQRDRRIHDWTHARASIAASTFKIIRLCLAVSLSLSGTEAHAQKDTDMEGLTAHAQCTSMPIRILA